MINYYIRKVISDDNLLTISNLLREADNSNNWIDGLGSGGGSKSIKNNLEISDLNICKSINDIIMFSLDSDKEFNDFTMPDTSALNIISKTNEGGYYNPHTDHWSNGDYSTTIFLNSPDEYDGGELCLYLGGDDEIKIKLDSGWAITYRTGILHRVNKVKSGSRYASVFWTKSLIKDPFIRHIYYEICNIGNNLQKNNSLYYKNCQSSRKDINLCIENLKCEIARNYTYR
jgi:PKHD-type hydroxylase